MDIPFKTILIDTATPSNPSSSIAIIYTGGTFGMKHDAAGALIPFDFGSIQHYLPTLRDLKLHLTVMAFDQPIDSSNVSPDHWVAIGKIIKTHYDQFDGFVVLHGTDTMAYTASALSFMLVGITKPVILTGAQLPISSIRTDARENLITALEIASAKLNDKPRVPEVCLLFNNELLRGNRSKKVESVHFDAFHSENYPPLAKAGVQIIYHDEAILKPVADAKLRFLADLETQVAILKLFPGISISFIEAFLAAPGLRGVLLETYGSGNAPTDVEFLHVLEEAISKGILMVNVSQCPGGRVFQGKYETSKSLEEMGVLSGGDMTTEAALTKMMVWLGVYGKEKTQKKWLEAPAVGEKSLS